MSEEDSETGSIQFTRSSIHKKEAKLPSTLSIPSSGSNENEKDELIEQYEKKMGEMLQIQQDLTTAQTQLRSAYDTNQLLQKQIKKMQEDYDEQLERAKQRIMELEKGGEEMNSSNQILYDKIKKWKSRARGYQVVIDDQNREIQAKENIVSDLTNEKKAIKEQYEKQIYELTKQLKQQKSLVAQLKVENNDLRTQSSASSESFVEQKKQNEELYNEKQKLAVENSQLKGRKDQLKKQLKHSSDDSLSKQATIQDQERQIRSLSEQVDVLKKDSMERDQLKKENLQLKDQITAKDSEIRDNKSELEKVNKALSKTKTSNKVNSTIISTIMETMGNIENPNQIIDAITKMTNANNKMQKKIKSMKKRLDQEETLQQTMIKQNEDIESLKQMQNIQKQKNKLSKAIENSRKTVAVSLNELASQFGYKTPTVTFRNVLVTVVLAKRLSSLPHFKSDFVTDSRNWWWISQNEYVERDEILQKAGARYTEMESSLDKVVKLNHEFQQQINHLEETLKQGNDKNAIAINSAQYLQNEIHELNVELSSLIDVETYESLHEQYITIKKQFKEAHSTIKMLKSQNNEVISQLEEAQISCQDQSNEMSLLHEEIEAAQTHIQKLQEEIKILYKSQHAKNKELLSLERGISKEKISNQQNTAQCRALAVENQQLFNQLHPAKLLQDSPDGQPHLSYRTNNKTLL